MDFFSVNDIENLLKNEIAIILSLNIDDIDSTKPLHELGLDSLSFVELFVFIEKTFNLKLMDANINQNDLINVQALAKCIYKN